jgi:nitrate/TMAO reductase-like tetraheme cytochrome c subunit
MQAKHRQRWGWLAALVLVVGGSSGCVNDRVVYRDANSFTEPPQLAANFVGYASNQSKRTVCGNCHIDMQQRWQETAHANAWKTLADNPGKAAFCEGCHTVNQLGNASRDSSGGWIATKDARYQDVQCENCHGPGLDHVTTPNTANRPLAPIQVGLTLQVGCGECHNGVHHPFVEEWTKSGHGRVEASPSTRPECISCHTGQGALAAFDPTTSYLEKNSTTPLPITCTVCHDPHSNRISRDSTGQPTTGTGGGTGSTGSAPHSGGQLRFRIDVPDQDRNLCIKCHHKRSQPDLDPVTQNSRGPHSPEGPLLLGEDVGFWFGDPQYDAARIVGTHGTERNPRLCAGCHLNKFSVTDKATGKFVIQATGHLFDAIPCINAQGAPTGTQDCAVTQRTFKSCTGSGCHGSEDAARSAMTVVNQRVATLAAELKRLVDLVRAREVNATDKKWTTAEGADFNYQLAVFKGSSIHNPFMIEALLNASIREMKTKYGLTPTVGINYENILSKSSHETASR